MSAKEAKINYNVTKDSTVAAISCREIRLVSQPLALQGLRSPKFIRIYRCGIMYIKNQCDADRFKIFSGVVQLTVRPLLIMYAHDFKQIISKLTSF